MGVAVKSTSLTALPLTQEGNKKANKENKAIFLIKNIKQEMNK